MNDANSVSVIETKEVHNININQWRALSVASWESSSDNPASSNNASYCYPPFLYSPSLLCSTSPALPIFYPLFNPPPQISGDISVPFSASLPCKIPQIPKPASPPSHTFLPLALVFHFIPLPPLPLSIHFLFPFCVLDFKEGRYTSIEKFNTNVETSLLCIRI